MTQENEGFFKNFHDTIDSKIDDTIKNNFANLETNSKRVSYLCSLPAVKDYDLANVVQKCQLGGEFPVRKDMEKVRQLKDEAGKAVLKGDWVKAMQLYSEAMVYVPQKETEELSILYANRSAALNHMELHEESLADIKRCLSLPYPRHLRYKVYERKARSLLVLKKNNEAVTAFQNTISALDEATNLDKEKRQKMRTDAKLMLEVLNKGMILAGNPKDPEFISKVAPKPKLTGKQNPRYPAASDAVEFKRDDIRGRYGAVTRDVQAGETILIEKAHSSVLLLEYSKTHCHNCFTKCAIPLPCLRCPNAIFCSEECSEIAQKSYHAYECQILPIIWKSGCSVTCHMAIRMITQNKKQYFTKIANELENTPSGLYKTDDYKTIYNLVSHEDKRTKPDLLHRTEMSVFFIKLLELSGYFNGKPAEKPIQLEDLKSMSIDEKHKDDIEFFGGLILKNLQVLQFNAHEVFELQCLKPKSGKNIIKHNGKSVFLAGAVFPTLALFNHSCDPCTVRYFCGKYVVLRAVKNLKKGEEIGENYGPIFTTVPKETRQATLKEQYWFDCDCVPCHQNWPLYKDMNENYMRFRCDSDQPCSNVVAVPYDTKEFMVQCGLCQQYTNVLKGLKSLQIVLEASRDSKITLVT